MRRQSDNRLTFMTEIFIAENMAIVLKLGKCRDCIRPSD